MFFFSPGPFSPTLLVDCSFISTVDKKIALSILCLCLWRITQISDFLNIRATLYCGGDNRLTDEECEASMWAKLLKTNLRKVMAFDCHKTSILCETNQTGLVDAEDANGRRNRMENVSLSVWPGRRERRGKMEDTTIEILRNMWIDIWIPVKHLWTLHPTEGLEPGKRLLGGAAVLAFRK